MRPKRNAFLEEEGTCQKSRKSDAGRPCKNVCLVNKMKQVGGYRTYHLFRVLL